MKNDEFAPLDESAFDEIEGKSAEEINAMMQEQMGGRGQRAPAEPEEAAEPSADDEMREQSQEPEQTGGESVFSGLDLSDIFGESEPEQPAAAAPAPKPEEKPESKRDDDVAYLREQLRNAIDQNNRLAERVLAMQQGPSGDDGEQAHERTIDDIDESNREYLMPLFKPGMDAAAKIQELERRLSVLAPLEQDAHQRQYGQHLEGAVEGFKADMMPAFMSWVNTLPEDVRERYATDQAGPMGAEVLAERYLRTRGGVSSGTQPRVSPLASQAASDMGGDSHGGGTSKGPSYESLMDLDDEKWAKIAARMEAQM